MGLSRKLSMFATATQLGRRWEDKAALLRLCASYGGLLPFSGRPLVIETNSPAAPRLHLRQNQPDAILLVEVLMEKDYRCLHQLSFTPASIVDIGGNIGLGSYYLKTLYPQAQITGFEPSPAEFEMLSANYAEWPGCRAYQQAIGEVDGATLRFAVHPDRTGGQHLLGESDAGDWQEISVHTRRLDCLIREGTLTLPDLVKIDIEGGEMAALQGMGDFLPQIRALVMETHSPSLHEACLKTLAESGHRILHDEARSLDARILLAEKPSLNRA
jgi:FkbM family methyltransferase